MNSRLFSIFSARFARFLTRAVLLFAFAATCGAQQTTVPAPTPWAITARSANSRIWQRTTYELSPSGQIIAHLHQYTELGTGICYQQPGGDGDWLDSQEVINILADGTASATNGQHQVYFPVDIYDGSINLITPDGLQLASQPAFLCYDDGTNIFLIGSLTNSTGSLVATNVAIYPNAFTGISADLRYTYRKSGFEQEIIFSKQLPSPETFGLDSTNVNLELVTEFFGTPEPTQSAPVSGPNGLSDSMLSFGSMKMVRGKAFSIGDSNSTNSLPREIRVYKSWEHVGSQIFLVEALPYEQIAPELSQLPAASSAIKMRRTPVNRALMARVLPPAHPRPAAPKRKRMASGSWSYKSGVVLDYQAVNGSVTNYTFHGDLTYYISSYLALYGTNNAFEGGTVIKFATNCYGVVVEGSSSGPSVKTLTANYLPVIFTASDDNTVGEGINNSTGNPQGYYANIALELEGAESSWDVLKNLRISYAETGIQLAQETAQFSDVQLMNCEVGCYASDGAAVTFENALFGHDQYDFDLDLSDAYATNATFSGSSSNSSSLATGDGSLYVANCILANVTNTSSASGDHNGFYDSPAFGSSQITISSNPFVAVGGGSYYLAGNTFRTNGTPNIDPALLADLAQKTTYPPIVYSNVVFSTATNFNPNVARENTNAPDLGYAYDPLDYVFAGCDVSNNFTVTAGTAIGWFQAYGKSNLGGQPYSFSLDPGANLSLNGTATQPCFYVNYAMVQEGGNGNWADSGGVGSIGFNGGSSVPPPQLSANFAKWTYYSAQGMLRDEGFGSGVGVGCFTNCEFYSIGVSSYEMNSLSFANCLFFRDNLNFWTSPSLSYVNCTFYNGCLSMYRTSPVFWLIENSAFDGTMFAWSDSINYSTNHTLIDYDAYNTNNFSWTNYPYRPSPGPTNGMLETNGSGTVFVTNYNWETSWFGNFYQPTNISTFHAGSTNANLLGLYWFTTQTNQTIEGNSTVTIGYQYVATGTSGNPLDYLAPPIPNYISDPSGASNFLTIVTQPGSLTVTQGYNAAINVLAVGVPSPLSYQWYWNGIALSDGFGVSGSGSATLNLSGVNPDQEGIYYVVVTNLSGSVTSSNATLTVLLSQTNPYDTPPVYLLPPYAYWNVTDISDPAQPVNIGQLQAPFSEPWYPFYYVPPPNTAWHVNETIAITNAYGTTEFGGISNMGTVFEIGFTNGVRTIHTFTNLDGAYPCSQLAISGSAFYSISNVLYGTTSWGGSNDYGTVFKLNADGSGFADLYEFAGANDGSHPQSGLLIDGNTLYGTTTNSIFKINTDGSGFTCLTNIYDASRLILSLSGDTLFGTTTNGRTNNLGMIFSISTGGTNLTDLFAFDGADGAIPVCGLELYGVGNFFAKGPTNLTLFGATECGGANGFGVVFSINTDGTDYTNLHNFDLNDDGAYPAGELLVTNNNSPNFGAAFLYGTTSSGGTNGGGTVFGMNLDGTGYKTFLSFTNEAGDAANPECKLVLNGNTLYGTTSGGGAHSTGSIFSVKYDGTAFTNLYNFTGGNSDGGTPRAGLALPVADNSASIWSLETTIDLPTNNSANLLYSIAIDNYDILYLNGNFISWTNRSGIARWLPFSSLAPYFRPGENDVKVIIGGDGDTNDYFSMAIKFASTNTLFGTTYFGGGGSGLGAGTVFETLPGGSETNLHIFSGQLDGENPIGDLVLASSTLYGVAESGGTNGVGEIFRINTDGSGYTNLYSFETNNNDGTYPAAGLSLVGNTLFGTTGNGGGPNNVGTVFEINTDGSGYRTLHRFAGPNNNDGATPRAPLLFVGTNLYGTTSGGGIGYTNGTIFSISTNGKPYKLLYSFGATNNDGSYPVGILAVSNATLYGTTYDSANDSGNGPYGVIYSLSIGSSNDVILHSFTGSTGGEHPKAGLVLSGGALFGTAYEGGAHALGTLFSLAIIGNVFTNILSFGSSDSDNSYFPQSDLLIEGNVLYGTTYDGGVNDVGIVFSINTNGTGFNDVYDFVGYPGDGANPNGGLCSP